MKGIITYLVVWLLLLSAFIAKALPGHIAGPAALDFVENTGQWEGAFSYRAGVPGGAVFFTGSGFVHHYAEPLPHVAEARDLHGAAPVESRFHAYQVVFAGADTAAAYSSSGRRGYYHNYFMGNDRNRWKGNVEVYSQLSRKAVWPGIDLDVYSLGADMKYDFVVQPGSDPAQIRLEYRYVDPELTVEGTIRIRTSVNEVVEGSPFTYQLVDGDTVVIGSRYKLEGRTLSFELLDPYDITLPLVIDPSVVFATHTGNTNTHAMWPVSNFDAAGNMYIAATVDMGPGWPPTMGAYGGVHTGRHSAAILKFDPSGALLLYSTFIGGSGSDIPYDIYIGTEGDISLSGESTSPDFPIAAANAFQSSNNGEMDIFVARLNAAGSALLASTYIGGANWETHMGNHLTGVVLTMDDAGNYWLGSSTWSPGFPTTSNALRSAAPGAGNGNAEGVLVQLSGDMSQLLYSTFIGGSLNDAVTDIKFAAPGRLVITGYTESTNFPITATAVQTSNAGGRDGFVMLFDVTRKRLLNSTYLGTAADETPRFIGVDSEGDIFIAGNTYGGSWPVSQGVYGVNGANVFIEKFSSDLSARLLSTTIGHGLANLYVDGFMVDHCDQLYVTGNDVGAVPGMLPYGADAFQQFPGSQWIAVLAKDLAGLQFSSYLGMPIPANAITRNTGYRSRMDPAGYVYKVFCSSHIATINQGTPGSFAPDFRIPSPGTPNLMSGVFSDVFACRMDFTDFIVRDTVTRYQSLRSCFATEDFRLEASQPGRAHVWNTGAVTAHLDVSAPGIYTVQYFRQHEPCTVYIDSFEVMLTPLPVLYVARHSCPGLSEGAVKISGTGALRFSWYAAGSPELIREVTDVPADSLAGLPAGMYRVVVSDGQGCDTTLVFEIDELAGVQLTVSADTTIPTGGSVRLQAFGADIYYWSPEVWLSDAYVADPVATPQMTQRYVVTGENRFGCRDSAAVWVRLADALFIPNAFTPNGDGRNDVFRVANLGYYRLMDFRIMNRWGELVFLAAGNAGGWDGNWKGVPAEVGTYHYFVRVQGPDGSEQLFKGDLSLIR